MGVIVTMCVAVLMLMLVVMRVPMPVPMPVRMATRRIGAAFRLEAVVDLADDEMHGPQHVGQDMIGLDLQVIRLELDLHMAVAQVIGRSHQVEG